MPFARINGIQLYYEVHGKGPAVVLAHGRNGNTLTWWQQVPALAKRYRVVTFDHRGFGRSRDRKGGPGRKAFVADLAGLLDHLDIGSARLVAQSMGGFACLGLAIRQPKRVRALVMAGTSGGISDPGMLDLYRAKAPPPADAVERGLGASFRKSSPAGAFLYGRILGLNPPFPEPLQSVLLNPGGPQREDLGRMRIPTLVLMGRDDRTISLEIARRCVALIPGARLRVVPNAGHSVYFERPDAFNRIVLDFLSAIDDRRKAERRSR